MNSKGRKRSNPIWSRFQLENAKQAKCVVAKEDGVPCGKLFAKSNAMNMEKHLSLCHSKEYATFVQEKELGGDDNQLQLTDSSLGMTKVVFPFKPAVPKERVRRDNITAKLLTWIASNPHIPYSVVSDDTFSDLIAELEPRFRLPDRKTLTTKVARLTELLKLKVASILQKQDRIIVIGDIYSDRKGTPYLGLKVYYFDCCSRTTAKLALAVSPFPYPHTAVKVAEKFYSVWEQYGLKKEQIFKLLSDNGSNIVKGFKESLLHLLLQQNGVEEEIAELAVEVDPFQEAAPNLDISATSEIADILEEFDNRERDFADSFGSKWMPCAVHCLQLVVGTILKCDEYEQAFDAMRALIRKVHQRKPGEELKVATGGKGLRTYSKTRFNGALLVIDRLLEVRDYLSPILQQHRIDDLPHSQWEKLAEMKQLLSPFAEFTDMLAVEETPTLSQLLVVIQCLRVHLTDASTSPVDTYSEAAAVLLSALNRRFAFVTDPANARFQAVYCVATLLDPRAKAVLPVFGLFDKAKTELINTLQNPTNVDPMKFWRERDLQSSSGQDSQQLDFSFSDVPPFSRTSTAIGDVSVENDGELELSAGDGAGLSDEVQVLAPAMDEQPTTSAAAGLLRRVMIAGDASAPTDGSKTLLNQVIDYAECAPKLDNKEDPRLFWLDEGRRSYPLLWNFAVDLLTVPVSSAGQERIFSITGKVLSADRYNLDPTTIERETMFKCNHKIVKQLIKNVI